MQVRNGYRASEKLPQIGEIGKQAELMLMPLGTNQSIGGRSRQPAINILRLKYASLWKGEKKTREIEKENEVHTLFSPTKGELGLFTAVTCLTHSRVNIRPQAEVKKPFAVENSDVQT